MAGQPVDLVALIDDSDVDLFVQRRFIEISAFARSVLVFQSAQKALDAISKPGQPLPDLIFLDLNMPEMDGFSFLEHLSKMSDKQNAKVVILTSSSSVADKTRAAGFGNVVSFISKPLSEIRLAELKELVGSK